MPLDCDHLMIFYVWFVVFLMCFYLCYLTLLIISHFYVWFVVFLMCFYLCYLTLLIISHGYLPADFTRTAMVPIIKNKTGDTSDKNNYRPIALVTVASKLFEICILDVLETYFVTHGDHLRSKSKHYTDMCFLVLKL